MNYWQVAAGEGPRDYSDVFLRYGIMFMGSGKRGPYPEHPEWYKAQKWGGKIVALADQVQCDDIVILKRPHHRRWRIVAIGRVIGEYDWLEQFGDVEGWDLQHCRRMEWFVPDQQTLVDGLSMGTFRRCRRKELQVLTSQLMKECMKHKAEDIPPAANSHLGRRLGREPDSERAAPPPTLRRLSELYRTSAAWLAGMPTTGGISVNMRYALSS